MSSTALPLQPSSDLPVVADGSAGDSDTASHASSGGKKKSFPAKSKSPVPVFYGDTDDADVEDDDSATSDALTSPTRRRGRKGRAQLGAAGVNGGANRQRFSRRTGKPTRGQLSTLEEQEESGPPTSAGLSPPSSPLAAAGSASQSDSGSVGPLNLNKGMLLGAITDYDEVVRLS